MLLFGPVGLYGIFAASTAALNVLMWSWMSESECFTEPTWDGSDFFSPAKSRMIIVTEKVRDLVVKSKIKNVTFVRITEFVRIGTTSVSPSK